MSDMNEPTIEVEGFLQRTTKKAILVRIEGQDYWFPWSHVDLPAGWRIGPVIFLASPWIIEERGLS
jgi:hypothetical protein